ncbi:MAG: DUF4019 domain-containing protein [bacterium]|nr:DUF4019 domain-containing protein [bacterium]
MRKPVAVIAFLLLLAAPGAHADSEATDAAVEAAEVWLALADSGEYEKSWDEAADYFKNAVTREKWVQSLHAARKPLGELSSRELKSADYKTAMPGAPDGRYVLMQFASSFSAKAEAIETVTFMGEPDGEWRMAGYFIK